ncbi:MAG: hypothetical protein ACI4F4_04520 [Lachnospiraceae bacterium]
MDFTVKLQDPFSYALWPIVVLGLVIIGIVIFYIVQKVNRKPKKKPVAVSEQQKPVNAVDVNGLRIKYLKQLDEVEEAFRSQKISVRKAFQKMSVIVRRFVEERTGIKTNSYTLADIKRLQMPQLESLISEFYSPEFSVKSEGDVFDALEKSRRIIEEWN